ncbi:MAG: hypothetical protein SFV81_18755 [Pirellulaceae bacterium]|nr:hypothetical protein [Pirellulaceae bacterium]
MYRVFYSTLITFVLVTSGCGGGVDFKTVPAGGVVLLDGKPLEGAGVLFMSKEGNKIAEGKTDASGKFTLKTVVGKIMVDGAIVGVHKVGISKTESSAPSEPAKKEGETPQEMVNRMAGMATDTSKFKEKFIVAKKYNSPETSQITATVAEGGSTDIEIKVTSK